MTRLQYILAAIGGAVLLAVICLVFLGNNLIKAYHQESQVSDKIEKLEQAAEILAQQRQELSKLQGLENSIRSSSINVESSSAFLAYLDSQIMALSMNIVDIPHEESLPYQGYAVKEVKLSVEGSYHSIVKFVHQIEIIDRVSIVKDLNISRKLIRQEGKTRLFLIANLTLQRLSTSNEN
ncbi:MAG: type 4a pilus biogenesis protein PilO [Bacteroidota bacterium]